MYRVESSDCCSKFVLSTGLCSDCKEHCDITIQETIFICVLDNREKRVIHMEIEIEYDKEDGDSLYEIENYMQDTLGHNDFMVMMSENKIEVESF